MTCNFFGDFSFTLVSTWFDFVISSSVLVIKVYPHAKFQNYTRSILIKILATILVLQVAFAALLLLFLNFIPFHAGRIEVSRCRTRGTYIQGRHDHTFKNMITAQQHKRIITFKNILNRPFILIILINTFSILF